MKIRRRCKCGCGKITNYGKKYISGHNSPWNKGTGKTKIRRRCKCGCGRITNYGTRWVKGHNGIENKGRIASIKTKRRLSESHKGINPSKKTRRKMSLGKIGNTNTLGYKQLEDHILKRSISRMKCHPNDLYCDIWRDKQYRKDLRKDYCENINCKGSFNKLNNHHIDLDKKNCKPENMMTLCVSCHVSLHRKLQDGKSIFVKSKDFIVINRLDHVSYINKQIRKKVVIIKKVNNV